jgi:hypothetical protein
VIGRDLCVHEPVTCAPGTICILPCLIIRDPPDTVSYTAAYGSRWVMSTAETDALGQPFLSWSGTPSGVPAATTNPDTVVVTSEATYRAAYRRPPIIIDPGCPPICVIDPIDPPILLKPSAREPEGAVAREPEPAGTGAGSP